jgi:hypothetical protein
MLPVQCEAGAPDDEFAQDHDGLFAPAQVRWGKRSKGRGGRWGGGKGEGEVGTGSGDGGEGGGGAVGATRKKTPRGHHADGFLTALTARSRLTD